MNPDSTWRPVCLVVCADDKLDASGVKQWLQSKQNLKSIDLSDAGFAVTTGPIAESIIASKQVSSQCGLALACSSPRTLLAAVQMPNGVFACRLQCNLAQPLC